jgi:rsbT antagonist protein RsbS
MIVSILRQGDFLIASIHEALDDAEFVQFQQDVLAKISEQRAQGVIIDLAALDVLDSYGSWSLRNLAHMARLRGAQTVIVGIRPEIARSVVELGMKLDITTALDLEAGLDHLEAVTHGHRTGRSTVGVLGPRTPIRRYN